MEAQHSTPNRHNDSAKYRCAIIGSGLAGLTNSYLLQGDERYNVAVFEQADRLSFDSASITVKNDTTNDAERIDLPMRASAGGYYHHLMRMYQHLEIPLHPIKFLFVFSKATPTSDGTVSHKGSDNESYFIHASNLHQTPPPWPGNRGLIAHITEILYLIVCQFWFTIACFLVAPLDATSTSTGYSESLSEYFDRIRLPRRYISHYLLPLLSGVATCTHQEMLQFPASDVVNYKKLSHGQQHYAVCGGVSQVQSRLTKGLHDIRLNSRVVEAVPQPDGTVVVRWQSTIDPSGRILEQVFDRVVLSVSPDVAGRIYKPLHSTLERFPTRQVESSVLKPEPSGISVVELEDTCQTFACMHHSRDPSAAQTMTLRTLFPDMGSPRTEALHTMPSGVVVSTCPLREAAQPDAIKKARFTRTLRSVESQALVQELMGDNPVNKKQADDDHKAGWVNGQDNVWVAGAWCWDGLVLLEGCIESAMRIASDFGVAIPWEQV
ncbi:hypothetical protein FPOAC2_05570 [Fusarium poae]|jgi:hypothetical protein|uniref:Amine oxidase domain-containing protein n=1 Tax=Fusarium poae TaxID=36050 RepID=A0A1B8AVA6_FUSPO|nr:hypothetical protein FPOAC1_005464 [Fusarium poae]KAG8672202.1 hypothetical protein FPOAC1_005464 [Fusarium poae]OBS24400.1 hypothetical protein FPOA_04945 [Fusarium poae]